MNNNNHNDNNNDNDKHQDGKKLHRCCSQLQRALLSPSLVR